MNAEKVMYAIRAMAYGFDFNFLDGFERIIYDRLVSAGINTPKRWAAFLGTLHHESGGFRTFEENLNYSEDRLRQVWPSRFKKLSDRKRCARNPKMLALHVYNGRMGNKLNSMDGWLYRGRGLIQLTGRNNYTQYQVKTGLDLIGMPDRLSEDSLAMWTTAAAFFSKKVKGKTLLELADLGELKTICKAVNGGYHGLNDRITQTRVAAAFLFEDDQTWRVLVRKGSRGLQVKQVQSMLRELGHTVYKIDGIFGKGTEKAVLSFQAKYGLVEDGIVGTRTYLLMAEITNS